MINPDEGLYINILYIVHGSGVKFSYLLGKYKITQFFWKEHICV